MASDHLKIAFVRRGFSPSGGAEAYLKRLAAGVCAAGHEAQLATTNDWPAGEWPFGAITRLRGDSPAQFAHELEEKRNDLGADVIMSLERVWRCDVYRAGDGVHRAWLQRRARFGGMLQKLGVSLNRKHTDVLRLEASLFRENGAGRVIANSQMVKEEIVRIYGYPDEQIDVVANGVPLGSFRPTAERRESSRQAIGLTGDDIAVLFVGSGWERKGLRFASDAVAACHDPRLTLLVAGRGNQSRYRSKNVRFLGVVQDVPALYAAADIFLLPTIYDPFSNACLEAAASGLPVITTRSNGFAEIIDEKHGSVIENAADVPAIASALTFWSDGARRIAAQPAILARASKFDLATNAARTLEILFQAAASAASTSGKIRNT